MYNWHELILMLPLAPLVREDFQSRKVDVVWLVLLGVFSLSAACIRSGIAPVLERVGFNTLMLVLLGGSLMLYLLMRRQPVTTLFSHYFGMGDLLFMLAITPLFPLRRCVAFLLVSCIIALGWWCIARWRAIPLVGVMGLVLAPYIIGRVFGSWT